MRVVFPCKGVIILSKDDMQKLESFYKTKLMTSKLYDYYKTSDVAVQIGNFNYFPKNYSFVLKDANLLSIKKLRDALDMSSPEQETPHLEEKSIEETPISDASIASHPFFQTLRPID